MINDFMQIYPMKIFISVYILSLRTTRYNLLYNVKQVYQYFSLDYKIQKHKNKKYEIQDSNI